MTMAAKKKQQAEAESQAHQMTSPKVITQPLPWWHCVLNFLFAEKPK